MKNGKQAYLILPIYSYVFELHQLSVYYILANYFRKSTSVVKLILSVLVYIIIVEVQNYLDISMHSLCSLILVVIIFFFLINFLNIGGIHGKQYLKLISKPRNLQEFH